MGQRSTGRQQLGAFHAGKTPETTVDASSHATRRAQNPFHLAGCSRPVAKNSLLDRNLQFEACMPGLAIWAVRSGWERTRNWLGLNQWSN
jgi:hypothetical protein